MTTDPKSGAIAGSSKPPAPYWGLPSPYKILRQPTPASEEPYQLPEGTAIDLRASGVGVDDFFYVPGLNDNSEGVIIMFAPEGRVSRVSYSQSPGTADPFDRAVVDNVYLADWPAEIGAAGCRGPIPRWKVRECTAATTDEQRAKLRQPLNWLLRRRAAGS